MAAPRSRPATWREPLAPPPDLTTPRDAPAPVEPLAATGRQTSRSASEPPTDASNKRDLGPLAGMFDDE